ISVKLLRRVGVPALIAKHVRIEVPPILYLHVPVDSIGLFAPRLDIFVIAGQQVCVHKPDKAPRDAIPVRELASLRHLHCEPPATSSPHPIPNAPPRQSSHPGPRSTE